MAHQVLARKWRPQNFDQLVGQNHVLQALSNALEQGRLHHAYLFSGTRGVGKTTIARILARCLNCEQGVTATPCGKCGACLEVAEGRSIDLIEVDAASRTKVDDTRELLDNVQFAPTHARYKVYLIDEVHMLSNSSFNALLKTLEEPPPHVIFLLATTHPQKIPATVLSRCLQFHLKNMTVETIVQHLQTILREEGIQAERDGLTVIARAASGSMRDALSVTEQAIAFGGGEVKADQVSDMLGVVDGQLLLELFAAIIANDGQKALDFIQQYAMQAVDFSLLVDELLSLLHRIAVEQAVPSVGVDGRSDQQAIAEYAGQLAPEDVQLYYQTALAAKRDLLHAPDPLTGLEMMVLRLLAFRRMLVTELSQLDAQAGDSINRSAILDDKQHVDSEQGPEEVAPIKKSVKATVAASEMPVNGSTSTVVDSESQGPQLSDLNASSWCKIYSVLPLSGIVRAVASHTVISRVDDSRVELGLLKADAMLYKESYAENIETGLSVYFSQPVTVDVKLVDAWDDLPLNSSPGAIVETPSMYKQRVQAEKQQAAVQAMQSDKNVQALIETFDGELLIDSIEITQNQ